MKNKMIELKCAMEDYISLCESLDDNAGRDMDELYRLESDISNRIVSDKFNMLNNALVFSDPKYQYNMKDKVHNLQQAKVLNHDALYIDARVTSCIDEFKTFQSRHSDDGEEYFSQIQPHVLVNNSGSFIVTKESYNDIFKNDTIYSIDLDPEDIYLTDGIVPIRFANRIPNAPMSNAILYEIECNAEQKGVKMNKTDIYELADEIIKNGNGLWEKLNSAIQQSLSNFIDK